MIHIYPATIPGLKSQKYQSSYVTLKNGKEMCKKNVGQFLQDELVYAGSVTVRSTPDDSLSGV